MPEITVLMPVHNGAEYIRESIASVLDQTRSHFELLVVDDCSTDDSAALVLSFDDPRIKLVRSETRLKLAGALNLGLHRARGEFIARMDADDVALPKRLEHQVRFLHANPGIGICGTWLRRFGAASGEERSYPCDPAKVRAFLMVNCPFAHPTVMFRRQLFFDHELEYDVHYYPTEDYELWSRALLLFQGGNLPEFLLRYRVHGASLTVSDWSSMDEQATRIAQPLLRMVGVGHDIEQARYHRQVAMVRIPRSAMALAQARSWLIQVMLANKKSMVFDQHALEEVLTDLWFRLCMHCSPVGLSTWRAFACPLTSGASVKKGRLALLTASVCKHMLLKRKPEKHADRPRQHA